RSLTTGAFAAPAGRCGATSASGAFGRTGGSTTSFGSASTSASAFESDRVDLADDVEAERFEGLKIGNLRVEAACANQPLTEIHVVVMVHHLVTGQRVVPIAVAVGTNRIEWSLLLTGA